MKLKRKGKLTRDQQGNMTLVNEKGEGVELDEVTVSIWQMCDGNITENSLVSFIAKRANIPEEEIKDSITHLIEQLEKLGFVERVE
jgi:hypothetical protein